MDQIRGSSVRSSRGTVTDHWEATLPSSRTRTRSASASASSTSWVTSSTPGRCRSHSAVTSRCISMRVRASSALKGSSSSSRSGSRTSARASEARCAWPPESCNGHASAFSSMPTSSRAFRACACRRARSGPFASASAMLSCTLRQGRRRGSWKATETAPFTRELRGRSAIEPGQAAQQCRLAGPAAAQQGDELTATDLEVKAAQHLRRTERAVQLCHGCDGLG